MADFKQQKGDLSITRFRKNGNYYGATLHFAVAPTTQSISSINSLRAFPFIVTKTQKFDRIAVRVTTAGGAGAVARLGVYADNGNVYPGAKIVDGGELSMVGTAPFVMEATISVTLKPGLYWLCVITGGATGTAVAAIAPANALALEGFDNTLTGVPNLGYAVVQTYGALPNTYPTSGASGWTLNVPLIALRKAS